MAALLSASHTILRSCNSAQHPQVVYHTQIVMLGPNLARSLTQAADCSCYVTAVKKKCKRLAGRHACYYTTMRHPLLFVLVTVTTL